MTDYEWLSERIKNGYYDPAGSAYDGHQALMHETNLAVRSGGMTKDEQNRLIAEWQLRQRIRGYERRAKGKGT